MGPPAVGSPPAQAGPCAYSPTHRFHGACIPVLLAPGCFRLSIASLICLVIAVHDGDTLTARCGSAFHSEKVRLRVAAIDAPESRQAFGQKSREHLARLCLRQPATLHPVEKDRYGRTVAHVHCAGLDVATAQVGAGMAWVYVPYADGRPGLKALQTHARSQGAGLWSQARPMAPWTYRQRYMR